MGTFFPIRRSPRDGGQSFEVHYTMKARTNYKRLRRGELHPQLSILAEAKWDGWA